MTAIFNIVFLKILKGCHSLFAGFSLVAKSDLKPGLWEGENFLNSDSRSLKSYVLNFDSRTFEKNNFKFVLATPISQPWRPNCHLINAC